MSWIAAIITLFAKYLVGRKDKWGHAIHIIGEFVWIIVALQTKIYGLMLIAVPTVILSVYNFWKWHKEDVVNDTP